MKTATYCTFFELSGVSKLRIFVQIHSSKFKITQNLNRQSPIFRVQDFHFCQILPPITCKFWSGTFSSGKNFNLDQICFPTISILAKINLSKLSKFRQITSLASLTPLFFIFLVWMEFFYFREWSKVAAVCGIFGFFTFPCLWSLIFAQATPHMNGEEPETGQW